MRNLLRYDFKYMWRIWWIGALASVIATVIGVFSIKNMITSEPQMARYVHGATEIINGISFTGILVCVAALVAFAFLMVLLTMYRYYRNFFTDEGYLTFTLPVTENRLLMSKSISGFVTIFVTDLLVGALGIAFGLSTAIFRYGFEDTMEAIWIAISESIEAMGSYAAIYIIEVVLLAVLGVVFNIQIGYLSITIGAVIAKKNKLLAGIGMYFVISTILSVISTTLSSVSLYWIEASDFWFDRIDLLFALGFGGIILVLAGLIIGAYVLNHYFLKRRLNLA